MSKIRRVFVDSRFKTADSPSNTDFFVDLPQNIQLGRCRLYVDAVSVPHSWYSVETGVNDKLFLRETTSANVKTDRLLTLPGQNYSGPSLATQLASLLNAASTVGTYSCDYGLTTGKITISLNSSANIFQLLTDQEISTSNWQGGYANPLTSANEVLRHSGTSQSHNQAGALGAFVSNLIDLIHVHTLMLHSSTLGNFTSIGPQHEGTILKRIPVTVGYGFVNHTEIQSDHDYTDVSYQNIKRLHFSLKTAKGQEVQLHGGHISFSLIFEHLD